MRIKPAEKAEAIPDFSSITSTASSVTFKAAVGTAGSVFNTHNGTVTAKDATKLIFEKGLHTSSSGSQKNGLSITNGSSVTIFGEASFKTSGYLGDAVYVAQNSTLRLENAENVAIQSSGNSAHGIVAESSTIEMVNSTIDAFMSNSVVGIDLTDSVFKLDQSSVATSDRRIAIDASTVSLNESDLATSRLIGSGTVEASEHSTLTLKNELTLDGSLSLADSALTTKTASLAHGALGLSGTSSFESNALSLANAELQLSGEEGQTFAAGSLTGENVDYFLANTHAEISIGSSDVDGLTLHGSGAVNDAASGDASQALKYFGFGQTTNADGLALEMAEGMYQGAATVEFDQNNQIVSQVTKTNSLMQSTLELASAAPLALNRILTNDVHKRMGDIRSIKQTSGAWVRYDGGKLSAESGLDNDFHTIQVGVDTVPAADAPRFGLAFSYTMSDADYSRGKADMDAYSLAAYGLWMGDAGQFVDVVARLGTAKTDMTVDGNKKGSMDNIVTALSGEFGWRFDLAKNFYVEPQVELAYTHVDADSLRSRTAPRIALTMPTA